LKTSRAVEESSRQATEVVVSTSHQWMIQIQKLQPMRSHQQ